MPTALRHLVGIRTALTAALLAMASLAGFAADVGQWRALGPILITNGDGPDRNAVGRVTSIAVDPRNPQVIFVGARGSGVWRTTDGGASWAPVTDALPTLTIAGLAVAPSQPTRVFAATNLGISRSDDGGTTWATVFTGDLRPFAIDGGAMLVSPRTPDVVYLSGCRGGQGGVMRSRDAGVTWTNTLNGCNSSLLMTRGAPDELVAGMGPSGANPGGVYTTRDGGDTWRRLTGCPGATLPDASAAAVKVARSRGRTFASFKSGSSFRLFRTTTATCTVNGQTEPAWEPAWQPDASTGPSLWSLIAADPDNPDIVYATGTVFWVSTDGGLTFSKPTPQPHVDHHAFAIDPGTPGGILAGSDGGIYRAVRGASGTWRFIGRGLNNVEFYDLADSSADPGLVIGGTQDNGTSVSRNGDQVWRFVTGGDSGNVDIATQNGAHWFEAGQAIHQIVRSTNGGSSFGAFGANLPPGCLLANGEYMSSPQSRLALDPTNAQRFLATCGGVWQGVPWTEVFTPPDSDRAFSIAVNRAGVAMTGTSKGRVFVAATGAGFTEIYRTTVETPSTDVEPDPFDAGVWYATFRGPGATKVVRLVRGGAGAAFTSADITSNLPAAAAVNAAAVDRLRPGIVFVATTQGVYEGRTTDGGRTWTWAPYVNGMHPATDVHDLEIHPTTGVMRAGTFGRGAFEVLTGDPIGSVLNATGRVTLLRAHDVGTGFGPPDDRIDVEGVLQVDTQPGMSFGLTLRTGADSADHAAMFDLLRDALRRNRPITFDYVRTGFRSGRLIRVMPAAN